jgi:hypothetical protein
MKYLILLLLAGCSSVPKAYGDRPAPVEVSGEVGGIAGLLLHEQRSKKADQPGEKP